MESGPGRAHGKKVQLTITVAPDIHEWMLSRVASGDFAHPTHAVDQALRLLKKRYDFIDTLGVDDLLMGDPETLRTRARRVAEMTLEAARARREGEEASGQTNRGSKSKNL